MGRILKPRQLFLVKTRTQNINPKNRHALYLVSMENIGRYPIENHTQLERTKSLGLVAPLHVRVLAGPSNIPQIGSNGSRWYTSPAYNFEVESILRITQVPFKDLPLYINMPWKSEMFMRLFKMLGDTRYTLNTARPK